MLNVDEVADRLGLEITREENSKGWAYGLCPLHSDRHESFGLNMETGRWVCFAKCGNGWLDELISKITNCSLEEARKWIVSSASLKEIETDELLKLLSEKEEKDTIEETKVLTYREDLCPNFLLDRGFSKKTLKDWRIGFDPFKSAAIIPVENKWSILRYSDVGMAYGFSKYVYEPGFPKGDLLFGLEHSSTEKYVVVVEGPLDCIWLYQCGIQSAVALLGSSMSEKQRQIICSKFDKVYLFLDNDDAGKQGTKTILRDSRFLSAKICTLPQYRKDAQECTRDEIVDSIKNAKDPIIWLLGEDVV